MTKSDEMPMHPIQALMDGMSAGWKAQRAQTQMTLGKFIAALDELPPERTIQDVGEAMSYRGYYSDLAFEPDGQTRAVAEVLASARACMGQTFEGYKGGDFDMGASTPIWSSRYSMCGPRIMGLNIEADPITLILAEEDL